MVERYPGALRLVLRVAEVIDLTPRMREVRLAGAALAELEALPGQDVMVVVGTVGERTIYRRYTIRRLDRAGERLDVDVVRHGAGPGSAWVEAIETGDPVEAIGPRGKITLAPDVERHLFVGDESALPMAFAMSEALPPRARAEVILEVLDEAEEQPVEVRHGVEAAVRWLHRGAGPPGTAGRLVRAVSSIDLSRGSTHAYVAAELSVVNRVRDALAGRGLPVERISAKAYWGKGAGNADRGEPVRD